MVLWQVGTNGYFTFDEFNGYSPFLFNKDGVHSLVAPFFTDTDISQGIGQIDYEIHTNSTSESILSSVDELINFHLNANFSGKWMVVATWDRVQPFGNYSIVRKT